MNLLTVVSYPLKMNTVAIWASLTEQRVLNGARISRCRSYAISATSAWLIERSEMALKEGVLVIDQ